jgi:kinesin family protein 5
MLGPETVTETLINKDEEITPEVEALFGITPRATFHLFENIKEGQTKGTKYEVKISYIEVYNEMINDILPCPPGLNLKIREFPNQGMSVIGMLETSANSPEAVFEGLSAGTANRVVCSTGQNARSSRSHTVFIIALEQTTIEGTVKKAKINLVDLAGSEKLSKTGAQGQALKEAKNINLSLTTLGRCIKALTSGSAEFVPYRESKLTLILKESLSGAAMTVLIVTGSMRKIHQEETIGTMQFAERAKMVKTAAKSNAKRSYDELDRLVNKLTDEVNALKKALKDGGGSVPETLSLPESSESAPQAILSPESSSALSVELADLKVRYETLEETSARQIEELKHSIERAETKMGNAEFVGIKEEMDSFKDRLTEATEQINRIKEEKVQQSEEYSEKLQKSLESLEELSTEMSLKSQQVHQSRERLTHAKTELVSKDAENFKIHEEIQNFEQTEARFKSHIQELERISHQEQEKSKEVQSEIEKLKIQLKQAENSRKDAKKTLKKAKEESNLLVLKVAELEAREDQLAEEILKIRENCDQVKDRSEYLKSKLEKIENEERIAKLNFKHKEEEIMQEKLRLEQEVKQIKFELESLEESNKAINEESKNIFIENYVGQVKEQLERVQKDYSYCQQELNEITENLQVSRKQAEEIQAENKTLHEKIEEISQKTLKLAPTLETEKEQKNKLYEEFKKIEDSQQKLIEEEENKVKIEMNLRMQAFIDQDQELKSELFKKQEDLQHFKNLAEDEVEKVKNEIILVRKENFELDIQTKNVHLEMIQKKQKNFEEISIINKSIQERIEEIQRLRQVLESQETKLRANDEEIAKLEGNIKQKVSERDTERKNSIIRSTLIPKRNTLFNKTGKSEETVKGLHGKDSKIINEALREAEELSKNNSAGDFLKISYEINAIKSMYGGEDESVPVKKYGKEVIQEEDEDKLD